MLHTERGKIKWSLFWKDEEKNGFALQIILPHPSYCPDLATVDYHLFLHITEVSDKLIKFYLLSVLLLVYLFQRKDKLWFLLKNKFYFVWTNWKTSNCPLMWVCREVNYPNFISSIVEASLFGNRWHQFE